MHVSEFLFIVSLMVLGCLIIVGWGYRCKKKKENG